MLTHRQVDTLDKDCLALPTMWSQHVIDGLQRTKDHAMTHPYQTPLAYRLDHLCIEEPGLGHPARLWQWPFRLPAFWLHPVPIVGEQSCQILSKPVRQKEGGAVGGQDLRYLMHHGLCHGQRTFTHIDGQHNLLSGSMAIHTQEGERSGRSIASAAVTSLVLTVLSRAKSSSSWTWWTRTSCRMYREKACSCSTASSNHCSTVLGSTSNIRAVPRMPSPSARQARTHTMSSTGARLPCKSVPRVSRK